MIGWHRRLDGLEFEQTPGGSEGQGSLVCCSPWGRKKSDTTQTEQQQLQNTITSYYYSFILFLAEQEDRVLSEWLYVTINITLSPGEGIGHPLQDSQASLVVQTVKNPPVMWETQVRSLDQKDPLEQDLTTHSSILAWRIPMDRGAWWATVHGIAKNQT